MALADLKTTKANVHLLYTDSNKLELLVYDTLKEVCEAGLESILNISTVSGFNSMLDMINLYPFMAKRWFVVIPFKKFESQIKANAGVFGLGTSTAVFLFKVENYKEFKRLKELLPKARINEMYLTYLQLKDVSWLLNGSGLSWKLIEFVYSSYSREPEKIMTLVKEISNGLRVETRRDITTLCGAGGTNITTFALSLLNVSVNTEKGAKMSLKRKLIESINLSREFGVSTFRNYLASTLKDIIDIKNMYLNGDIYDAIRGVPDCFDEKRLSRYKFYFKRILEIPMEDVVQLYVKLNSSGYWRKEIDIVSFLYNLYGDMLIGGDTV